MSKTLWWIIGIVLAIIIGIVAGIFIGRATVKEKPATTERIVCRVLGKRTVEKIDNPIPYAVHDTVTMVKIPEQTDTAALYAVWRDYYLARDYELDFSNDSLGEFKVIANVSENKLVSATSSIRPIETKITETTTINKVKTLQGYILLGTSVDFGTNQIGAGIDIKQRVMVGASAVRMNDNWSYTINLGIKF